MGSGAPIGIFDSGLGGLSVTACIHDLLPFEDLHYFGDSANAPYGTKSPEAVAQRCMAIGDRFMDQGVKAMVIACNTATSVCVEEMRQRYPVPIIGMEPALKLACQRGDGRPQRVIVAATPLTLKEDRFSRLMDRFKATHAIFTQPCPDLVRIVESGHLDDHDLVDATLHRYLDRYDLDTMDSIVLGCTHFVFFRGRIARICPPGLALIDGNGGTARHLRNLLAESGQLKDDGAPGRILIANSDPSARMLEYSRHLLESGRGRACPSSAHKL
ncbi:glutamate racemase [uncultured Bifidobacterium sp.]|uniref:glutamate racemase n=1 Tax=uncultured Bifidobacterium sp. TaxID=165187 RepID=UPI0026367E2D|nr:glutamate racemase [uncultured Bifidobacterium sp.]